MSKLLLSAFTVLISVASYAECRYCTSVEDALDNPLSVIYLDLKAQGLKTLPTELNQFVNLKHLDLSDNMLMDLDFSELHLTALTTATFENNMGLNFMEIDGIGNAFPHLKQLNLSGCGMVIIAPEIGKLSDLEVLKLNNNDLNFLPSEIKGLKSLNALDVSNNKVNSTHWLKELWSLEELNISNNDDVNLYHLALTLKYKDSLEKVILTPKVAYDGIPSGFGELDIKEIELFGGTVSQISKKVSRSQTLKHITFNNVELTKPSLTYSWLNGFGELERVDFVAMQVPDGISTVNKTDEIRFKNCTFENKEEVRKIAISVKVVAIGTDVTSGGYIGNAKKIGGEAPAKKPTGSIPQVEMSDEMASNQIAQIVAPEQEIIKISGDEAQKVELEFSRYEIPKHAFLTASGELYTGPVELKITEYKDPILNALAGVPMVYRNGDGNNLFASSGMIDFRAYDENGNELQVNPDNIIQVELNNLQPAEQTALYTYSELDSNWVEVGEPESNNVYLTKKEILDLLNEVSDDELIDFNQRSVRVGMMYKKKRKDPYQLSFTTLGKRASVIRSSVQVKPNVKTANPDQTWICDGVKNWEIDTVITPEIAAELKMIKKSQNISTRYWKNKSVDKNVPHQISDLKIDLDAEHDNYRLTFNFRGKPYSYPVVASLKGSPARVQAREKRNYDEYQKKVKMAQKEQIAIEKYKNGRMKRIIQQLREERAEKLEKEQFTNPMIRENLQFGLVEFGLVNCDYYGRNVPSGYAIIESVRDDRGEEIKVPDAVRNVFVDDNSYVLTSSQNVPVYEEKKKGHVIFFMLSAIEVAVIKGWEILKNGNRKAIIERVSIEGVPPTEIRQKILDSSCEN